MDIPALLAAIVGTAGIVSTIGMGLHLRMSTTRETAIRDAAAAFAALEHTVHENAERLAKMEARADSQAPFFTAMQSRVIDLLHHPDPRSHELDGLLEKLKALTLTPEDRVRLERLLSAMQDHADTESHERQAATALLTLMPLVIEEGKADPAASLRESKEPVRPVSDPELASPTGAADALLITAAQLSDLADATNRLVDQTLQVHVARTRRAMDAPAPALPLRTGAAA